MEGGPPVAVFVILPLLIGILFIGLPWLVLHYITKWRQAPKITVEDEQLLDDMFTLARRLEERLDTVERIASSRPLVTIAAAAGAGFVFGILVARR